MGRIRVPRKDGLWRRIEAIEPNMSDGEFGAHVREMMRMREDIIKLNREYDAEQAAKRSKSQMVCLDDVIYRSVTRCHKVTGHSHAYIKKHSTPVEPFTGSRIKSIACETECHG